MADAHAESVGVAPDSGQSRLSLEALELLDTLGRDAELGSELSLAETLADSSVSEVIEELDVGQGELTGELLRGRHGLVELIELVGFGGGTVGRALEAAQKSIAASMSAG